MTRASLKKMDKRKRLAIGALILTAVLAGIVYLLAKSFVSNDQVAQFERTSDDFIEIYHSLSGSQDGTLTKTCTNLSSKLSTGSLVCEIQFEFMANDEVDIDIPISQSNAFELLSKDDAVSIYDASSTRWRIKHGDSLQICTIDKVTYNPEEYALTYKKTVEADATVIKGGCVSGALNSMPAGYTRS